MWMGGIYHILMVNHYHQNAGYINAVFHENSKLLFVFSAWLLSATCEGGSIEIFCGSFLSHWIHLQTPCGTKNVRTWWGTGAGGRWWRWWWCWWHLVDTHMEEGHCKWNSINIQMNETFAQLLPLQFRHTFSLMDMIIIINRVVMIIITIIVPSGDDHHHHHGGDDHHDWSNHCWGMFQRLDEVLRIRTCGPINRTKTNWHTVLSFSSC